MGRDKELEAGSSAHYEDPAYYADTYRDRTDDVAYYVSLAEKARGPVLEYGIGNGRIALPMARAGASVVGVDLSRPMVESLRAELSKEAPDVRARVRVKRGDMRTVSLNERFPLVLCTFNTALHLFDRNDVERFLAKVRSHLAPGGTFVVDLSVPNASDLSRDKDRAYKAPRFRHPDGRMIANREYFNYDPARQILFVSMEFEPVLDPASGWMTPLAHRQFFPKEWEALLHYNGFEVTALYGDFHRGALTEESDVMVFHSRARKGFRAG